MNLAKAEKALSLVGHALEKQSDQGRHSILLHASPLALRYRVSNIGVFGCIIKFACIQKQTSVGVKKDIQYAGPPDRRIMHNVVLRSRCMYCVLSRRWFNAAAID